MKKEMTLETNDEAVDLSRRSMISRLGLVASVAIAAPVLMTMSTSALARHKEYKNDKYDMSGGRWFDDNSKPGGNNSGEWEDDDDDENENGSGW